VDHAELPAVFGGEKTFSHGLRHKRSLSFEVENGCLSSNIFTPPGWDEWQGQYPNEHG
jgi:hypothetical protein